MVKAGQALVVQYRLNKTYDMKRIFLKYLVLFFAVFTTQLSAQIKVHDIFNRELNDHSVILVDWQGHLMNPMVKLVLSPPSAGVNYPLQVVVKALGTSRLMLNSPSSLTAGGAWKTVTFDNSSNRIEIQLAIAPDREGGFGEIETYQLGFTYGQTSNSIPIKVIDLDDDLEPILPLVFDSRTDSINYIFDKPDYRNAAELAVKDWFYFFDYESFDMVPAEDEVTSLPGNNWENHVQSSNNQPYNGFWIFMRGIDAPYSTGYPTNNGKHPTISGIEVPGRLPRSANLILQDNPDANWFLSTEDNDWYLTNPYTVADVYGVMMHEFGHSIVFHYWMPGFSDYAEHPENAIRVIDYQGTTVPVGESAHLVADERSWDRLSGHSAGYSGVFPPRRWMLTKLTLLIAQEVGWKLREIGPFTAPGILTDVLSAAVINEHYSQVIESNMGGVPFYDWTITEGALPNGLSLDRFTGEISGMVDAEPGTYNFTVQLKDYDELSEAVTKSFLITVPSCSAPATVTASDITSSEATIVWNDSGADSYSIQYRTSEGDWVVACSSTNDNEYTISGLSAETEYIAKLITVCPDGDLSRSINFTTTSINVSVADLKMESDELILYPNPVNDLLTIKNLRNNEVYSIFDTYGSFIFSEDKTVLNVRDLEPGIYLLKTNRGSVRFVKL